MKNVKIVVAVVILIAIAVSAAMSVGAGDISADPRINECRDLQRQSMDTMVRLAEEFAGQTSYDRLGNHPDLRALEERAMRAGCFADDDWVTDQIRSDLERTEQRVRAILGR